MVEAVVNPLIRKYEIKRYQSLLLTIISGFFMGIIFCFNNSGSLIDGLATWVTGIWQMIIGIFELVGSILIWKCYDELAEFNNKYSALKWNKWFKYLCLIVIPVIIMINLLFAFYKLFNDISDNPFIFLTVGITMGAVSVLLFTFIFTHYNNIKITVAKLSNKIWKRKDKLTTSDFIEK